MPGRTGKADFRAGRKGRHIRTSLPIPSSPRVPLQTPISRFNSAPTRGFNGGSTVRRAPGQEIVDFLSFSNGLRDGLAGPRKFRQRDWKHALRWLDDAGLAFYFLRKIKATNATNSIPPWVMSRLEQNFTANRNRVGDMARRFDSLNRRFNDAGVRYVVLKGHSLVPEFR